MNKKKKVQVTSHLYKPLISTQDFIDVACSEDLTEVNIAVKRKRAGIDLCDSDGQNVMHHACKHGKGSVVSFLLKVIKECTIFHTDEMKVYENVEKMGARSLKNVITQSKLYLKDLPDPGINILKRNSWVKSLRQRALQARVRAYLDLREKHGKTALHFACQMGHLDVVRILVEQGGANLEATDQSNWSALHWALKVNQRTAGHSDCAVFLINVAVQVGTGTPVRSLPSTADKDGLHPLHWACRNGDANATKALTKRVKINPDVPNTLMDDEQYLRLNHQDNKGWQVHHWAALGGNEECLGAVLSIKIPDGDNPKKTKPFLDINATTNDGLTPCLIATMYSKTTCVRICHRFGCNDPEDDNETAKIK